MADREEDDLQMALTISLQGSPPEAKRSEPRESVKESPETRNRRVQRELMAAAEKRIRAAGGKIVSSAKPRVETVDRKVAAAGTSVSRSKEAKAKEEELVVNVEKVEKLEEGRELDLGEELAPEVMDHLFSMVFGSDASRDILAQWSNQGIRFSTDPETRMGLCNMREARGVLATLQAFVLKSAGETEENMDGGNTTRYGD